jgi:hypothetical protein
LVICVKYLEEQRMRKKILFFMVLICLSFVANAQNLQRGTYNDGRILAYIEQRQDRYRNNPNQRADRLQLENISSQEITVHYCFKAVGVDANGTIFTEETRYRTETLKSGEKKYESGYLSARGYYVDSFAIMNVSVRSGSTPQSVTPPPQSGNVPSWAQGTWGPSGGTRITSTQFIQSEPSFILNCVRNSSGSIDFEGTVLFYNNPTFVRAVVQRTDSSDRIRIDIFVDIDGTTGDQTLYYGRYRRN